MASILCRLCATTDENGIVVVGDEKFRKVIPLRVQDFLGVDVHNGGSNCLTICRNCQSMVETINDFYYKVQGAQQIWAAINIEVEENEDSKVYVFTHKPKRREAKLVPFLVRSLDAGRFRGLVWENRNIGLFRLPWPRQGTNRWKPEDSQLFKEWAILKGRYCEKEDFVLWKTCIRTSLHKLPNVTEVREMHNFSANPPYKVYRITDFTESFLASSTLIHMDHNYTRSDEVVEAAEEQKDENDEEKLAELVPQNISPIHITYYENIEDVNQVLDDKTTTVQIRTTDENSINVGETVWLIAQEETIEDENGTTSPQKTTRFIASASADTPSHETVARWIHDLKWPVSPQNASEPKKRKLAPLSVECQTDAVDDSPTSSEAREDGVNARDGHSGGNISPVGSEMSLHMSTSSDEEDTLITNAGQTDDRIYEDKESGIICSCCDRIFPNIKALRYHINTQSDGPEEKKVYTGPPRKRGRPPWKTRIDVIEPSSQPVEKIPSRRGRKPKRGRWRGGRISAAAAAAADRSVKYHTKTYPSVRGRYITSGRGRKRPWPAATATSGLGRKRECPECGKMFDNVCELVKHRQKCRIDFQSQEFASTSTPKAAGSSSPQMKSPQRSSINLEPVRKKIIGRIHKCNICDKTFKDMRELEDHLNSHWNVLAYHCKICIKRFSTVKDLQEHLRTTHSKS